MGWWKLDQENSMTALLTLMARSLRGHRGSLKGLFIREDTLPGLVRQEQGYLKGTYG